MKTPEFSIIIPVKNGEKTIAENLASIYNQEFKDFEIIVVDDNSTDRSREIVKRFKCNLITLKKNYGAANARNVGAAKAKGKILIFTDSDIVFHKDTLKKIKKHLKRYPKKEIFLGMFSSKLRFKNIFSQYKHLYLLYYYLKQGKQLHTLDTSLTIIYKNLFDKFKFNENVKISEDAELGMRLLKAGHSITQVKDINIEHIKKYSFFNFIKTDFIRGKRFSRLFLRSLFKDNKESSQKNFFLNPINIYLNVGLMPFLFLFLLFFLFSKNFVIVIPIISISLSLLFLNLEFWNYLRKHKGFLFSLKGIFVTFLDVIVMDCGISVTFLKFIINKNKVLEYK